MSVSLVVPWVVLLTALIIAISGRLHLVRTVWFILIVPLLNWMMTGPSVWRLSRPRVLWTFPVILE